MVSIKRRQFLQFSASTLAMIGLSQFDFLKQAQGLDRALAQGKAGKKLALLVGINVYPDGIKSLDGCLTDVEMQYELLVHRYGFDPKNILVLADTKLSFLDYTPKVGTRANILEAFQKHLIDQAEPEDVVVFHYSGHGSRVTDPNPLEGYSNLNGTLVPADVTIQGDETNQIMGKTLFLLSSLLRTDNFTMVLDSCHSGAGTRGSGTVRSTGLKPRSGKIYCDPNAEELAFQKTLLKKLSESPQALQKRRSMGIARGIALGSAQKEQEAIDKQYHGFYAGMFTYLLTRYLWQLPKDEPLKVTFGSLGLATKEASNRTQEPIYDVQPQKNYDDRPVYFMPTIRKQFADAVVRNVEGDTVRFWLGGVSSQSLQAFNEGAMFDVIDEEGASIATVTQLGKRSGLEMIGKVTEGKKNLQVGMFMRERLRSIPLDMKLRVGLDPSLGKDMAVVRAELAKVLKVEPVVLGGRSVGEVHCIFGRLTPQTARSLTSVNEPMNSWGLFNSQGEPIPGTFQNQDLPPDFVVKTLRARLKLLLANQILGSTVNGNSSLLKVKTVIRPKGNLPGPVITQMTGGTGKQSENPSLQQGYVASQYGQAGKEVKASLVDIVVTNEEEVRSLHIAAFVINDDASISLIYPSDWSDPESASLVAKGAKKSFEMQMYGPAGFFELLVVASTQPLREMLRGIQTIARGRGLGNDQSVLFDQGSSSNRGESEDTIGDLMGNLVGDMSRAGGGVRSASRAVTSSAAVAVMSISLRVVDDSAPVKVGSDRDDGKGYRC